ncbi:DUF1801 domain-containing protein [Mesonia sp. HuA40]|uniref:DUF1801 domain-containing protein n=1 Tax=Mesonia sp. HuA40 TaxID=2602761 RepID=UPI0011CCAA5B|nr:DUF1801 domain-containing protein [Mesonia sp. HuA40]TXK72474.1 DUF1801 domain-containing protein [Mesonia sp. HuA40]
MGTKAETPEAYIKKAPEERQEALKKLRQVINDNLPESFEEGMQYGMIGYYVPHSIYPDGYHCNSKEPLPFLSFASQKNSINLYHSGIYAKESLKNWFVDEYGKYVKTKLDMAKSCIRFKNINRIPFELIAALAQKMTVNEWIALYEQNIKK